MFSTNIKGLGVLCRDENDQISTEWSQIDKCI